MRKKMALMSVDEASMYLREVIYIPPHQIRLLAREGKCTFCIAIKNPSGSYSYHIERKYSAQEQAERDALNKLLG